MARLTAFYRSTIGKKLVMAASSIVLFVFVALHMYGNLHVFGGPQEINEYGEFLRAAGAPMLMHGQALWTIRIVLLAAVLAHVIPFLQLWSESRAARRTGYRSFDYEGFSQASRTMKWGGILILAFVVYHILHMTTGTVHPDFRVGDVYHNLMVGLASWPVALFYIVTMIALGLHLYHGLWSAMQTLGINNPHINRYRRPLALGIAVVIALGFIAVPAAIVTGTIG